MKNNMFKIIILILSFFISSNSYSEDQFNFNIKEITITDNGNIFKGFERGEITTNDGIKLNANEFEYTKDSNILIAIGDVKVVDEINNYIINSKKIIYYKNENIIFAKGNSKAENSNNSIIIEAENFEYFKTENKLVAKKMLL